MPDEYECEICNYKTIHKRDYNKHIKTERHMRMKIGGASHEVKDAYKWECECGKRYKYDSGLSRHKKVCSKAKDAIIINNQNQALGDGNIHDIVLNLVEENKELRKMIVKQMNQIDDMIPKIGNNNTTNNNTFNLQVFLTEECKDALNLNDFIDGLKIKFQDLEHTKKYGLCEGIQNIFVNGLKELGTYKRPIHCTDIKRETLYIKDNNNWQQGHGNKETLKRSLQTIAHEQRKVIKEWEANNPDWNKSEKGKEEWIQLVKAVTSSFDDDKGYGENKIIKNIAKEVKIK